MVGYLDGAQERIKYPNRLATQLRNSHEILNLLDSEGRGWLEENKKQMANFTEQQVHEIVLEQNLEPGQTYQRERNKQSTREMGTQKGVDPRPDRPRYSPQVFGLADQNVDENMARQQDDIDIISGLIESQVQHRQQDVAPRFRETLAENMDAWPSTYMARRNSIGGASSSGTHR